MNYRKKLSVKMSSSKVFLYIVIGAMRYLPKGVYDVHREIFNTYMYNEIKLQDYLFVKFKFIYC